MGAIPPGKPPSTWPSKAAGCSIAIRRDDLSETMSRYLIERIEANPRIEVLARTDVRALTGGTISRR